MAKVLVTGGAGFIGSHMVDALIKAGHKVSVVDNLSTGQKTNINKKATFHNISISDKKLEEIIKEEKPEIVSHLAAQISVKASMQNPMIDAQTNVVGSLNLLNLCHKYGVKRFIFSSTGGALYGEPEYLPCDEDHPILPLSGYGVAKRSLEMYLLGYGPVWGLPFVILRYANVYGPRQDPFGEAGVVAIFARHMLKGETVTINGTGKQSRDFVYVSDVVRANLMALEKGTGGLYNIGTAKGTSVNDIFSYLKQATGYKLTAKHGPAIPGEVGNIYLKSDKAKKELGWIPSVPLSEGLQNTVEYIRKTG
ncbi:MAG: NAD-dependent epimerase/dehydratase family protein [Dehalococcoidia bacterium]|nr:NAD-dependent epimerase/dehydratase family protein [Dehalococcoidia bacterium]